MTIHFTGIQPLEGVAIEERPIGHSDQRSESNTTGVYKQHHLKRTKRIASHKSHHRECQQQSLHQLLRQLLPLPIHLRISNTKSLTPVAKIKNPRSPLVSREKSCFFPRLIIIDRMHSLSFENNWKQSYSLSLLQNFLRTYIFRWNKQ